ncbi:MAG TPA: hypothetical protein VHN36_09775, partial [Ilumatobacteraceae bacterium]|nr:hypothetical protein [Ilumatobacteraceae bacterium]
YTITVDDTWTETSGTFVKEVEAWRIGRPLDGFAANVNVLTQDALGKDLQEYMDFSAENMGAFQLIDHQIVEGVGGHELGLLEYTGSVNTGAGTRQLHFLATVDVIDGQAVVATLTTDEGGFLAEQAVVEPYLLSLRST